MVAVEDWYSENPNVVIMTNLDDIGQPYSCEQWGDRHQDFNAEVFPLMIDDGTSDNIWPWFHSGGYPSAVFIDHNMNVYYKMIGVSFGPSTATIDSMIDDCGELCTLGPPAALFDFSIDGNTVSFFDFSEFASEGWNIVGWDWNFGDGNTSSNQNPNHTYDSDGTYEVSLIITTDTGAESDPYTAEIQIGSLDISNMGHPSDFKILKNYPNPFNPTTTIEYYLNESGIFKMDIYDINGRIVDQIINGHQMAGQHSVNWHPSNIPSGLYYAVLQQGSNIDKIDIMYIK